MRIVSAFAVLAPCPPVLASKDGMSLAVGVSGSTYANHSGESFLRVVDGERASGWLDFMFKIGPSGIAYQAVACCTPQGRNIVDERKSRLGASSLIGLAFFPAQHIGIELAAQATAWCTGDLRDIETEDDCYDYLDTRIAARSLSASFQYRF